MKKLPTNSNGFSFLIVLLVVGAAALAAGGGYYLLNNRSTTLKTEDGTTITVKKTDKEFKISSDTGTMVGSEDGVRLPSDFPKDYPVYPKGKITTAMVTNEGALMAGYTLETKDNPDSVIDWFRKEGQKLGWKVTGEQLLGDFRTLSFVKGEMSAVLTMEVQGNGVVSVSFSGGAKFTVTQNDDGEWEATDY